MLRVSDTMEYAIPSSPNIYSRIKKSLYTFNAGYWYTLQAAHRKGFDTNHSENCLGNIKYDEFSCNEDMK